MVWKTRLLRRRLEFRSRKTSSPRGENEVRQLMLLIDTNNNGKITKKEWMAFMEAEFDRLEKKDRGVGSQRTCTVKNPGEPLFERGQVTPAARLKHFQLHENVLSVSCAARMSPRILISCW